MSGRQQYNVLFLCTGNSARSILAECILNREGEGKFRAFSAGSYPKGEVNPHAIALLEKLNYRTAALRSKSWDEFAVPGAPQMDFVITVCDQAAGEVCPIWPGQPVSAHWGIPDPAAVQGDEPDKREAFESSYRMLWERIESLVNLPLAALDQLARREKLDAIGRRG